MTVRTDEDWLAENQDEGYFAKLDSSETISSFFLTIGSADPGAELTAAEHAPVQDEAVPAKLVRLTFRCFCGRLVAEFSTLAQPKFVQAVQSYGHPHAVSSNTKVLNPSLGGMARKGGTVTAMGGQQQLDVRYHCLTQVRQPLLASSLESLGTLLRCAFSSALSLCHIPMRS